MLHEIKHGRKVNGMPTVFIYCFGHSKSIKDEKRKADSYYYREQTRNCIGSGGTPSLTTLYGSKESRSLLLQRFHLLLVYLLFLCKRRKPTFCYFKAEFLCAYTAILVIIRKAYNLMCDFV